jgi:hypothetical protein
MAVDAGVGIAVELFDAVRRSRPRAVFSTSLRLRRSGPGIRQPRAEHRCGLGRG